MLLCLMLVLFVFNLSDGGRSPFHVLDGRVLYLSKVSMTFREARKFCNAIDGDLASLHSDEEAREVVELIDEAHDKIWLGAKPKTKHESNRYEWFEESSEYLIISPFLHECYSNCCALVLTKHGSFSRRYDSRSCSSKLPFICSTTTLSHILLNESAVMIQQEFSKLKNVTDDLDTQLKGLSSKVSSLNDAVADVKTKGENSSSFIDLINSQVTKLAGDASDMKIFSQHLTSKLHTMDADVSSKLSSLETKVNSMNVNSITSEIVTLNGKLERMEEHLERVSGRMNHTDVENRSTAAAMDADVSSKLFSLETKVNSMDVNSIRSGIVTLNGKLVRMEKHLERVSGRMNHTDAENRSTAESSRFLFSLICFFLVLLIFVQAIFFLSKSAFASKVCVTLFSSRSPLSPSKGDDIYSEPLSPSERMSCSPSLSATYSVSPENVAFQGEKREETV